MLMIFYNETTISPKRKRIKGIINGWKGYYNIDDLTLKEIKQKLELLEKKDNSPILKIILLATLIELDDRELAKEKILNYEVISEDPKIHKDFGLIAMELKLIRIAYEEFLKSFKLKSDDPETLYYLGLIYLDNNKIETSIKFFQKALDFDSNFSKARYALSIAYKKLNLNSLSNSILKNEIKIDSDVLKKKMYYLI